MNYLKEFWEFLKKDTWQSWIVSIILIVISIKIIFFPLLSLITGTSLPLVVVESCSMYHSSSFESWWNSNGVWYEDKNITKDKFSSFTLKNGLTKGDIVVVRGAKYPKQGEIIIFTPNVQTKSAYPIIHRVLTESPLSTKGDNNPEQLKGANNLQGVDETKIEREQVIGKAVIKIPLLGWIKLIFFEPLKPEQSRGFCK